MITVRVVFVVFYLSYSSMGELTMHFFITARCCSEEENEYAEYEPKVLHVTNVKKNCQLNIIFLLPSAVFSKTL